MIHPRLRYPALALVLAVGLAAACSPPAPPRVGLSLASDGARWVAKMMRTMPFEDKVAQMIGCRYSGDFLPVAALIAASSAMAGVTYWLTR